METHEGGQQVRIVATQGAAQSSSASAAYGAYGIQIAPPTVRGFSIGPK